MKNMFKNKYLQISFAVLLGALPCWPLPALAQLVAYMAAAPKSNAAYVGYGAAAADATGDLASPVPVHLRNAPTTLMKDLGYGKGYKYAHDEADGVADMSCLPEHLEGRAYYTPTDRGFEANIKQALERAKARRKAD